MEVNFNVSAEGNFERVWDPENPILGHKYILSFSHIDGSPVDHIATFTRRRGGTNVFESLYKRIASSNLGSEEGPWTPFDGVNPYELQDDDFNADVMVYDLGDVGQRITQNLSPDDVAQGVNRKLTLRQGTHPTNRWQPGGRRKSKRMSKPMSKRRSKRRSKRMSKRRSKRMSKRKIRRK